MAFDWGSAFSTGGQYGAIPGAISGIFSGNQQEKVDKLLKQIPDEMKKYLMPYINAGQGALPHLNDISGEYEHMYKDPNEIISRIGAGYQKSPGYDWQLDQGENAITNAAAAGGMAGTAQHQQQAGTLATNLANQDFQNYLSKALGVFGSGLEGRRGVETDIFKTGAGASSDLATSLAQLLDQRAKLEYERGASTNKGFSDMASSIMSLFGK